MDTYNNVEQITRLVIQAIESAKNNETKMSVPVGVSARHIHLTQKDVEILFGKGYQLTKKKELMGGQFAANEQCTIVGLKLRAIENVRILGPVRKQSQVEISATDARTLGIKAPLRQSGDTVGSAPIALVGPKGVVYLDEGCIIAARHIHMTPSEAAAACLKDGDYVSVRMGEDRGAVLDNVKIRVDDSFTLEMHIDTDEANACQVKQGDVARIISKM
ncbi:MAG: phosphate propanoyltransferase [Lachnospiraceae bacterium]|nr:phosphate propanoyltransferase [Lachnospiraceae bacterium]